MKSRTPNFKTEYCGLRVESTRRVVNKKTGHRRWWLSFYCTGMGVRRECGNRFETTLSVAVQADARIRPLRCKECQDLARDARDKVRPPRTPPGDWLPPIPFGVLQLLKQYQKKSYYQRILQMTARNAGAQAKAGIVPEWARIVADAVMLAEMEAAGAQFPADWTPETRGQGLKIQSYDLSAHAPPL